MFGVEFGSNLLEIDEELVAPGTNVGDFWLNYPIGRGSFGVVYLGHDANGHAVACKVARRPSHALLGAELAAQQDEVDILTRLKHPSVVGIKQSAFLPDGRLCLVMELVKGVGLRQHCPERKRLDVIEVVAVGRRIAEALAYCHALDVLHLDLKPDNIMVTDPFEPAVKVLDFGLARLQQDWAGLSTRVFGGTPAYLPPEAFSRAPPAPERDLYALGTILYELLAGRLPVIAASLPEIIRKKRKGDFPPLAEVAPDTPTEVVDLVHALLSPSPTARIGSAAALAGKLRSLFYLTLAPPDSARGRASWSASSDGFFARSSGAFVGRGRELDRLLTAAETSAQLSTRPLLVTGDPGVGKTRLVAEAIGRLPGMRAAREGRRGPGVAFVGSGRCRAIGEFIPYSAVREVLGQLGCALKVSAPAGIDWLAELNASELAVLRAIAPEFREDTVSPVPFCPQDEIVAIAVRERVSQTVHRFVSLLAARAPTILVFEDLQWADEGTASVLAGLASAPPPGMLLVATSRTVPPAIHTHFEQLHLDPLEDADSERLVRELTGDAGEAVVGLIVGAIPRMGRGNPLVMRHVMRDVESAGYLVRDENGRVLVSARPIQEYRAPDSVYALVGRNVERLGPNAVAVLHVASLIDRQFLVTDLCALRLFSEQQVEAAVTAGCQAMLCHREGDICTFTHDTVWEGLGRLPAQDSPELHSRIAQQLSARSAAPGRVGHHLELSGARLGAATAYATAARDAELIYDPGDAIKYLRRAIGLLLTLPSEPARDDALADAAHDVVRLAYWLGNVGESVRDVQRCDDGIPQKKPRHAAAITSAYARAHYAQGEFARALDYSARCMGIVEMGETDRNYRLIPISVMARTACGTGRFGPAVEDLRSGCRLAKASAEYHELSHSEGLLGVALAFTGDFESAWHHVDSSLRVASRLNDPVRLLGAYFYRAAVAEASFRWSEGVAATTALLDCAERRKVGGIYLYLGTMFAGRHQFHLGRPSRASTLLKNALHLAATFGISLGLGWGHAFLGDVEFLSGRLVEAKSHYDEAVAAAHRGLMDEYAASLGLVGASHCGALLGENPDAVIAASEQGLTGLRRVSNRSALAVALNRQSEALDHIGARASAVELRRELSELLGQLGIAHDDLWPTSSPPPSDQAEGVIRGPDDRSKSLLNSFT